jgi:hypothetical protein
MRSYSRNYTHYSSLVDFFPNAYMSPIAPNYNPYYVSRRISKIKKNSRTKKRIFKIGNFQRAFLGSNIKILNRYQYLYRPDQNYIDVEDNLRQAPFTTWHQILEDESNEAHFHRRYVISPKKNKQQLLKSKITRKKRGRHSYKFFSQQDPFETNNYLRRGTKAHKRYYSPFIRELSSFNSSYSPFSALHRPNLNRSFNISSNKFSFLGVFDKYNNKALLSKPFRYHKQSFIFSNRESHLNNQSHLKNILSTSLVEQTKNYQNNFYTNFFDYTLYKKGSSFKNPSYFLSLHRYHFKMSKSDTDYESLLLNPYSRWFSSHYQFSNFSCLNLYHNRFFSHYFYSRRSFNIRTIFDNRFNTILLAKSKKPHHNSNYRNFTKTWRKLIFHQLTAGQYPAYEGFSPFQRFFPIGGFFDFLPSKALANYIFLSQESHPFKKSNLDLHTTIRGKESSMKNAFDNFVSNPLPIPSADESNYLIRKYWFQNVLKQSIRSHLFSQSLNSKKQNFRSFMIFRLKFIEQVNRKKKFYSQFSHFDISPFFSSSNRIAAILLGISNNFIVNSNFSQTGYPVIEPYYFSNPARTVVVGGGVSPRIFSFNLDPFSNNRVLVPSQIDNFSPFFDTFFSPRNVYTIFEEELVDYEFSDLELDGVVDRFFVSNKLARNIQFFDRLSKYINEQTQPQISKIKDKTRRRAQRALSKRDLWNFKRFGPNSYLFRKGFPTYQ